MEDAARAFGLEIEGPLEDDGERIWPDNWLTVQAWATLSTQWRLGPSGQLAGLDYGAIVPTLELMGVERAEWRELFQGLRQMEAEVLSEVAKRG